MSASAPLDAPAAPAAPALAPAHLSATQRARRERVLSAVVDLVGSGHLDDLQMKDISARSGVALGTIYRYFSSKDHVLAAALASWATGLDGSARSDHDVAGAQPTAAADRAIRVLRRGMRAFARQPAFAQLLMIAAGSHDPNAGACFGDLASTVNGALGQALPDLPQREVARILRVLGAVWWMALVDWVNGRQNIAHVHDDLESACHLLLDWREAVVARAEVTPAR